VDTRLRPELQAEFDRRRSERLDGLPRNVSVVLVGQRAAGKTTLLPHVASALGRKAIDLDDELARVSGRSLRDWVRDDQPGFRNAERETFLSLPRGITVAVGGGFLSHHASALHGCVAVEVPISFDTYCERLRADATRPRLRPELSMSEELREVYGERMRRHAAARPMSFVEFLLRLERGERARRVVTLPPGEAIESFAWRARHAGADLLEVRTDLHPPELDLLAAARALPLLVAERGAPIPSAWLQHAALVDHESPSPARERVGVRVWSRHEPQPLDPSKALERWGEISVGTQVKHVEPLGEVASFPRLLETQARLLERFGEGNVTVLATGPQALPFRAVLNQRNALDYTALDASWRAAEGQRLLADAVREARAPASPNGRLAIIGSAITHSRSPRIHHQPFDRIELPPDTDVAALVAALHPHHRGFAVTNPFKKRFGPAAVNTLIRTPAGFRSENTDVAGARAMWEALGEPQELTVLGDGGVTAALRTLPAKLEVVTREHATRTLSGTVVWTWPADVTPHDGLRFAPGTRVAVLAYGPPARRIAATIRVRGGAPLRLGPRWFIAQARQQRTLWESAST
jgi:shikimate kinase